MFIFFVDIYRNASGLNTRIFDHSNSNSDTRLDSGVSTHTRRYFRFERSGTTATLKIYTDSARTNLLDTLSITCETGDKRYMYAMASRDGVASVTISGDTRNFEILENSSSSSSTSSSSSSTSSSSESCYVDVDDDFTGTNGDPPNVHRWRQSGADIDKQTIQSNKLNFNSSSDGELATTYSRFLLSGDFDIQIDYDYTTLNQPSSGTNWAARLGIWFGSYGGGQYSQIS